MAKDDDLNPDEESLLIYLANHGPHTIKELARLSYISDSEMERCFRRLIGKGLVRMNENNEYYVE